MIFPWSSLSAAHTAFYAVLPTAFAGISLQDWMN
jgi:hypothetical protein